MSTQQKQDRSRSTARRPAESGGLSSTGAQARMEPVVDPVIVTSTEAKNGFGRVLDAVARNRTVLITKHNTAQAVVMSVDRYRELTASGRPELNALTAEFDELLGSMQSREARSGLRDAFSASAEELSRAAVAAAEPGSVA